MANNLIGRIAATAVAGASWSQSIPAQAASDINPTSSFDTKGSGPHMRVQQAPIMSEPVATYSKTEIDAKLALSEEKAGRANDGILTKLDLVLEAMKSASARTDTVIGSLSEKLEEVRDDNKNTRRVTLVTVVLSALAAVAAIYAAQANNIAAMQVGIEATRDAITPQPAPAVTPAEAAQ